MTATRRHFTAQEKVQILRLHLLEHKPVSEVCDQYQLSPTIFYRWQKDLFEHGASRYIVSWDIRESMTEPDVEIVLQKARERFPEARPRIISDNGPPFIAQDFKEFIRIRGMTPVRTSPYYPQSNGKMERGHQSAKTECIRPKTPLSLEDARRIVADYVRYYNTVRLHSAIGYITPLDKLEGRAEAIFAQRDAKLEAARKARRQAA